MSKFEYSFLLPTLSQKVIKQEVDIIKPLDTKWFTITRMDKKGSALINGNSKTQNLFSKKTIAEKLP